jgi:excisionase family DNA binding protein
MESQHELLTIREVADELRVHPETVRSLVRSGRLKGTRLGTDRSELRVSRRDLRDFIQRGEQRHWLIAAATTSTLSCVTAGSCVTSKL